MAESFPMNGGDGVYSYIKNSQYQKQASDSTKGMIRDAILSKLDTKTLMSVSTTFRIVDFGCSVGPNTFFDMDNMIQAVRQKAHIQCGPASETLEFQVFFSDHIANDFNTLFDSLPVNRQYHVAAAPGSFHTRLFPRASITLAYSSYALQWLSRVPGDGKPMAWNEGRVHYTGSTRDVMDAYADQFEEDMGVFISARAQEIVSGGMLVVVIPGVQERDSHTMHTSDVLYNCLGSSLMDLANEGIVDKAEIDAFNLPIYNPTVGEMKKVVEKNGCFSIEQIELTNPGLQVEGSKNIRSLIVATRAALESIFTKHFGKDIVEKMFDKTLAKSEEIAQSLKPPYPDSTTLFVVLKRK